MWVRIMIGIIIALIVYSGTSDEQKENIKEGFSNIVDNITELQNITEVPSGEDGTSLTLLGKPTKEITFDCTKNIDCIEFGDDAICQGGLCYG